MSDLPNSVRRIPNFTIADGWGQDLEPFTCAAWTGHPVTVVIAEYARLQAAIDLYFIGIEALVLSNPELEFAVH